jgi:hypothetical protein
VVAVSQPGGDRVGVGRQPCRCGAGAVPVPGDAVPVPGDAVPVPGDAVPAWAAWVRRAAPAGGGTARACAPVREAARIPHDPRAPTAPAPRGAARGGPAPALPWFRAPFD